MTKNRKKSHKYLTEIDAKYIRKRKKIQKKKHNKTKNIIEQENILTKS